MAYPKQFLKLSMLFAIVNTDEVANTSVNITTLGGAPFDAGAALALWTATDLQNVAIAYAAMLSAPVDLAWASYSHLVGIKLAAVGTDGHYVGEPKLEEITGIAGDNANVEPQSTAVVSLWSGLTFGQANYGRMYPPHTKMSQTTGTPYAIAGVQADYADSAVEFITAVNDIADGHVPASGVVILSAVGSGSVKAASQVRIGRLNDTQRRRRNNLTEDYVVVDVV